MVRDVASAPECLSKLDEMRVYAFNGNASDRFQVYHSNTSVLAEAALRAAHRHAGRHQGLTCPIAAAGLGPADRDAHSVAGIDHERSSPRP
jgi:hypothetical protein